MKKALSVQTLLFALVNFPYFFIPGAVYDGRLWYQFLLERNFSSLFWFTNQARINLHLHLYAFLATTSSPLFWAKVISFFSLLTVGLIFRWALELLKIGSSQGRFWAGVWFCLMPSYLAGFEFSHAQYNLGFAAFFVCLWMNMLLNTKLTECKYKSVLVNLMICLILYWTFSVNRALYFMHIHFVVVSFLVFKNTKQLTDWINPFKEWSQFNFPLLLIPLISWILRDKPFGEYAQYNQVNISQLGQLYAHIKMNLVESCLKAPIGVLKFAFKDSVTLGFGLLMAGVIFYFIRQYKKEEPQSLKITLVGLCYGVIALLLAIFPYAAVAKVAFFNDVETRHAIFFVFSQALILLFGFDLLTYVHERLKRSRRAYTAALLAMSLIFGLMAGGILHVFRWWDLDWYKHEAIKANLKYSAEGKAASRIILHDKYRDYYGLWRNAPVFYELTPLAEEVYGGEDHLVMDELRLVEDKDFNRPEWRRRSHFGDIDPNGRTVHFQMDKGELDLWDWKIYLSLKKDQLSNYDQFLERIRHGIKFELMDQK